MVIVDKALDVGKSVARFVTTPGTPVFETYHRQPAPARRLVAKTIGFALLVFIGLIYGFFITIFPPSWLLFLVYPLLIPIAMVIWALPDTERVPTGAVTKLFFIYIFVAALWPNYIAIALPGLPWISFRRLILAPMVLLLVLSLATSRKLRTEIADALKSSPIMLKLFLAYLGAQLISFPFSSSISESIKDYINSLLAGVAVFIVAIYVALKPGNVGRIVLYFTICAIIAGVLGLAEKDYGKVLWADNIPSFLHVDPELMEKILSGASRGGERRVQGPFSVSLSLAEFLALMSPLLLHMAVRSKNILSKLALILSSVLNLIVVVWTQSRLGLMGYLVVHSMYTLFFAIRLWRQDKSSIAGPALTLAYPGILAFVAAAVLFVPALHNRVLGGGAHVSSDQGRDQQWSMTWERLATHPLGYGPGQGAQALGWTNAAGDMSIDSGFISILLDYGIVGFCGFFGMLGYAVFTAGRIATESKDEPEAHWAIPIGLILLTYVVIRYVLSQGDNSSIAWIMLGCIVAMGHRYLPPPVTHKKF